MSDGGSQEVILAEFLPLKLNYRKTSLFHVTVSYFTEQNKMKGVHLGRVRGQLHPRAVEVSVLLGVEAVVEPWQLQT